jgi:hypothetical protein
MDFFELILRAPLDKARRSKRRTLAQVWTAVHFINNTNLTHRWLLFCVHCVRCR